MLKFATAVAISASAWSVLSVLASPVAAQVWDREVATGVTFRMERQSNPPRNLYGLRVQPDRVRPETALAGKTIYDLTPNNGRSTVSAMVREHNAIGGVNGDFFQWGRDPGGDPMNLMVRGGELLSHPGSGARGVAVGWGPEAAFAMGSGAWTATFRVNNGSPQPIDALNTRTDKDQVTLYTDSAAFAYASEPAAAVRVRAGAYRLGTDSTFSGTVTEVLPLEKERLRIASGEFLLTGAGKAAAGIRSLKAGDRVEVQVQVTGFDWSRVNDVMGGGPILVQNGKKVLPGGANDFNDTRHPRTAMGRTADGSLWFVVVDGRQEMSVGASLAELAEAMQRWGCVDAINLDGGGSSTMNLFGVTLNRPSGGVERTVANAVLLYGERPAAPPENLRIVEPQGALVIGKPVRIAVTADNAPVPAERVVFTAQGSGWIDQEGMLHPVKEGMVDLQVMVNGATAQTRLKVVRPEEAALAGFRVLPYLQEPSATGMRLTWFTTAATPGDLIVTGNGKTDRYRTTPERRSELGYSPLEESERADFPDMFTPSDNYKHTVLLKGLKPDTQYTYTVNQSSSTFTGTFRTAPTADVKRPLRIIAFADSETDPEGRTTYRSWKEGAQHTDSTGRPADQPNYLVTETVGFQENLKIIGERQPDLMVLSGDIVQGGGYQRAWDEFFFHTAGKWDTLMSRVPLIAALGNWECFGARNGGYSPEAIHASRRKYLAYFDAPANNNPAYQNVYHRIDYGPVTLITLDSSNGLPDNTDADTNKNIDAALYPGKDLPDINPGSDQWKWCEAQLKDARRKGQIILVQFHHIPYSSGGHSLPLTAPGSSGQAGLPMRAYTKMFAQYGVAAVLCGHNESFERSIAEGILFYDAGVAGDGLGYSLSKDDPRFKNPFGRWVAHHDSPELWKGKQLISGGKHYGHLEIDITPLADQKARLRFTPVHSFPVTNATGRVTGFERRLYADTVEIEYNRHTGKYTLRETKAP